MGAVTPYYPFECANRVKHVIDPTDMHKRVDIRRSVFDCNLRGWNVLSISTVEHIGTGDYKFSEKHTAVEAVVKILRESKSCLITAPIGYNAVLDEWVYDNRHDVRIKLLKRGCNNHWDNDEGKNIKDIKYGPYWANGLIVIEK